MIRSDDRYTPKLNRSEKKRLAPIYREVCRACGHCSDNWTHHDTHYFYILARQQKVFLPNEHDVLLRVATNLRKSGITKAPLNPNKARRASNA